MPRKSDDLRAAMKAAILKQAGDLISTAESYRSGKERLGEVLAAYQQLYGRIDFALPKGIHDAMAMGRAPGLVRRRQRKSSNAVKAALAITQGNEVLVPLRMREIHDRLVHSRWGREGPPSLATLQSTITRSGLFERTGKGLWRLMQPVNPDDVEGGQLRIDSTGTSEE